ncbi:hypothetical protein PENPOL_c001G02025 [Penicillium polonicum]|uniref:RNase H type-1 domain-containing protein n=1 Tax=Penicillium polonicum TaxID=60169 RepID=A0A1V6P3E5_PENPO|nr:hypothetical protein PENPOL_c001G02025 [Penicillium polonicum]
MFSYDSDLPPGHSPMTTLPPPPGTTEATPTGLKDREVPMTPSPAQYAPVTSTEPQGVELEEGEVMQTPSTPKSPLIPSIEIDDEEVLSSSMTTQRAPLHANLSPHTAKQDDDRYVRSQNPSPKPASRQLGPVDNTPLRPDKTSNSPLIPSIEIDDEEVLASSMTTQRTPLHANPSPHTAKQGDDRYVRSQNPSPEPASRQLGPVDNTPPRPDKPSLKRKRPEDAGPPVGPAPPPKKQKRSTGEDKKGNKFCWEVGQEFVGFAFHVDGEIAKEIARNIHKLPVPTKVHKRLIYFCDASIRSKCGAAGVVWQESFGSSNWIGMGFHYPESTVSTATVELFAIACTMQIAIRDIIEERGTVVQNQPVDTALFQQHSAHTMSHLHNVTKEVFIFTDDFNALRRIDGGLAYGPKGDMARQVEAISAHSKTLSELGVHVELHLSPGHSAVPGNIAADGVAKRKAGTAMARRAEHELILARQVAK